MGKLHRRFRRSMVGPNSIIRITPSHAAEKAVKTEKQPAQDLSSDNELNSSLPCTLTTFEVIFGAPARFLRKDGKKGSRTLRMVIHKMQTLAHKLKVCQKTAKEQPSEEAGENLQKAQQAFTFAQKLIETFCNHRLIHITSDVDKLAADYVVRKAQRKEKQNLKKSRRGERRTQRQEKFFTHS